MGRITRSARRLTRISPALALGIPVHSRLGPAASHSTPGLTARLQLTQRPRANSRHPGPRAFPAAYSLAIPRIAAPADGHRDPVRRLKTVRRPPIYPNGAQAISPVAPSPLFRCPHAVHRCPSVDSGLNSDCWNPWHPGLRLVTARDRRCPEPLPDRSLDQAFQPFHSGNLHVASVKAFTSQPYRDSAGHIYHVLTAPYSNVSPSPCVSGCLRPPDAGQLAQGPCASMFLRVFYVKGLEDWGVVAKVAAIHAVGLTPVAWHHPAAATVTRFEGHQPSTLSRMWLNPQPTTHPARK